MSTIGERTPTDAGRVFRGDHVPERRIQHPTTHAEWGFPFPQPGRARREEPGRLPPRTAYRWPFRPITARLWYTTADSIALPNYPSLVGR